MNVCGDIASAADCQALNLSLRAVALTVWSAASGDTLAGED